jgi:hypothetical protein
MIQACFHGILVDAAFTDRRFPESFKLFARRQNGGWGLFGIEVPRLALDQAIQNIQASMREDEPFYSHLYDDETMIVLFKKQVFRVTPHYSSWDVIKEYGKSLNIPVEQLDFWPNRFQDEIHYFERADFIR